MKKSKIILIGIIIIAVLLAVYAVARDRDRSPAPAETVNPEEVSDPVKEEQPPLPGEAEPVPAVLIHEDVPFTAQAPFGDWDDVKQDYGCEEACLLMAMHWVRGEPLSPDKARDEIIAISEFELKNYQHHHDYSIADTHKVLKEYFGYDRAVEAYDIGLAEIKDEIRKGNVVIIPIDGRKVTNPNYSVPGPFHHQVLAVGYDDNTSELVVHDPGTRQGAFFRYAYEEIEAALSDYETGLNEPVETRRTAMLVIRPD